MEKAILGIDPALAKTGLCVLNHEEKFVVFDRIIFNDSLTFTYKGLVERINKIKRALLFFMSQYAYDVIAIETPLPKGQMSSGGSALTTVLVDCLIEKGELLYSFHPSFLRHALKKRDYNHIEYVELARKIIEQEGYTVTVNRFSADEAVAFLMAYRISVKENMIDTCFDQFKIKKEELLERITGWQEVDNLQRLREIM